MDKHVNNVSRFNVCTGDVTSAKDLAITGPRKLNYPVK